MPRLTARSPELLPVLGRGRHRTPRSGACFMEYASFLAGERWSDHPACTHSALAVTARLVNDCTSDRQRNLLVTMIPTVVGLTGDGTRTSLRLAVRAVAAAIPVASQGRQRALAAGALRCELLLDPHDTEARTLLRDSLETTPDARDWATKFVSDLGALDPRLTDRMCEAIIRTAVVGIAEACIANPDERLRALLEAAIADCVTPVDEVVPVTAKQLQPSA